ncbi:MAG: hypothetical protein AAF585_21650, partial [Verrucomicrobiota bacterium]
MSGRLWWHLIRFEALRLRWQLLGWAVVAVVLEIVVHGAGVQGRISPAAFRTIMADDVSLAGILTTLQFAYLAMLAASVFLQRPAVSAQPVWMTQPLPPRLVVFCNVGFVLLLLVPWLMTRAVVLKWCYAATPSALVGKLIYEGLLQLLFISIAAWLAIQVRNIRQLVVCVTLWALGFIGFSIGSETLLVRWLIMPWDVGELVEAALDSWTTHFVVGVLTFALLAFLVVGLQMQLRLRWFASVSIIAIYPVTIWMMTLWPIDFFAATKT